MSGYKNFAIVGAGAVGNCLVHQFLKDKAVGTVNQVVVLTRQGSKTTIDGDAKVIPVDYSNKESIKDALTGSDVVISTIAASALGVQQAVAEAAKEAGVKLFVPSEFGSVTEGSTEGLKGSKATVQDQLKAVGIPYTLFYNGAYADFIWVPLFGLDVTSGKVTVGGNGNEPMAFTARSDMARYISYTLTQLPTEQLENRAFAMAGDTKSFNEIFRAYEAKTGKKLEVTYIPLSDLDARLAADPQDMLSYLRKIWAASGSFSRTDNHLYPNWNPSPVIDHLPVA